MNCHSSARPVCTTDDDSWMGIETFGENIFFFESIVIRLV